MPRAARGGIARTQHSGTVFGTHDRRSLDSVSVMVKNVESWCVSVSAGRGGALCGGEVSTPASSARCPAVAAPECLLSAVETTEAHPQGHCGSQAPCLL